MLVLYLFIILVQVQLRLAHTLPTGDLITRFHPHSVESISHFCQTTPWFFSCDPCLAAHPIESEASELWRILVLFQNPEGSWFSVGKENVKNGFEHRDGPADGYEEEFSGGPGENVIGLPGEVSSVSKLWHVGSPYGGADTCSILISNSFPGHRGCLQYIESEDNWEGDFFM